MKTKEEILDSKFANGMTNNWKLATRIKILEAMEEYGNQRFKEGKTDSPCMESFDKIVDLRQYLLLHPDQEMIKTSCLHFLGGRSFCKKCGKNLPKN